MVKRERGKERTKKCHDTPATRGDLRVLKKNFFKLTFIAALCSAPKSKSFWHVMNIGHIITAPGGGGGEVLDVSLVGEVRRGPSYPDPV